jgi:hypothetical protein
MCARVVRNMVYVFRFVILGFWPDPSTSQPQSGSVRCRVGTATAMLTTDLFLDGDTMLDDDPTKQWRLVRLIKELSSTYGVAPEAVSLISDTSTGRVALRVSIDSAAEEEKVAATSSSNTKVPRDRSSKKKPQGLPRQSNLPAPRDRLTVLRPGTAAFDHEDGAPIAAAAASAIAVHAPPEDSNILGGFDVFSKRVLALTSGVAAFAAPSAAAARQEEAAAESVLLSPHPPHSADPPTSGPTAPSSAAAESVGVSTSGEDAEAGGSSHEASSAMAVVKPFAPAGPAPDHVVPAVDTQPRSTDGFDATKGDGEGDGQLNA